MPLPRPGPYTNEVVHARGRLTGDSALWALDFCILWLLPFWPSGGNFLRFFSFLCLCDKKEKKNEPAFSKRQNRSKKIQPYWSTWEKMHFLCNYQVLVTLWENTSPSPRGKEFSEVNVMCSSISCLLLKQNHAWARSMSIWCRPFGSDLMLHHFVCLEALEV